MTSDLPTVRVPTQCYSKNRDGTGEWCQIVRPDDLAAFVRAVVDERLRVVVDETNKVVDVDHPAEPATPPPAVPSGEYARAIEDAAKCIDVFQDIIGWQPGESRNALVAQIRDKVLALAPAPREDARLSPPPPPTGA